MVVKLKLLACYLSNLVTNCLPRSHECDITLVFLYNFRKELWPSKLKLDNFCRDNDILLFLFHTIFKKSETRDLSCLWLSFLKLHSRNVYISSSLVKIPTGTKSRRTFFVTYARYSDSILILNILKKTMLICMFSAYTGRQRDLLFLISYA